jgi:hypothetical protein
MPPIRGLTAINACGPSDLVWCASWPFVFLPWGIKGDISGTETLAHFPQSPRELGPGQWRRRTPITSHASSSPIPLLPLHQSLMLSSLFASAAPCSLLPLHGTASPSLFVGMREAEGRRRQAVLVPWQPELVADGGAAVGRRPGAGLKSSAAHDHAPCPRQ